ncbi:MAG: PepSY domain-containing protein [Acutalibacteraceae bacterium]
MHDKDIEKQLRREVEEATPDVLDKILKKSKEENGVTIVAMPQKKKNRNYFKAAISVAAVIVLVFIGSFAFLSNQTTATCRVEFNVNPCVVLEIDKNERVADVSAENDDAKIILDDMDLIGTDMDVAVNALMFSMIKHGYIDEMTNSVLVSVSDNGDVDYQSISQHIVNNVNEVFSKSAIEGCVMIQSVHNDDEISSIANQYGISEGKAALIKNLVDNNLTAFSYDALSKLSINEINILMNESNEKSDVTVMGTASRKAYIGEKTAKSIAYNAAGVNENDVKHKECSLSLDDGVLVYEMEFIVTGAVHEYEIDALTGKILKYETEPVKAEEEEITTAAISPEQTTSYKTKEEIKQKVLQMNDLTASDYKTFEIEMEIENSKAVYEVEFVANGIKYEYELDAVTGDVLSFSSEALQTEAPQTTSASNTSSQGTQTTEKSGLYIGTQKAKEIAFEHSQIKDTDKIAAEIEFGYNNGVVYCVEFDYDGMEYEYEINAHTGEIVDFEKSVDD